MDPAGRRRATPGTGRREIGLTLLVVSLLVAALPASPLWLMLSAMTLALAAGLPLAVADSRITPRLVPVAVVVATFLAVGFTWNRAGDTGYSERDRSHDGGVIVTEAAADEVRSGRNPYTADYRPVLPDSWAEVQGSDGVRVPNPVVDHFPYLPAAALVHVPLLVAGEALGTGWDTRALSIAVVALALVAIARRGGVPAHARLGTILGLGGVLTIVYQGWGTNDAFAVAAALLALSFADRSPALSGILLAVAMSAKLLLAVLLPPLAVVIWMAGGWEALRRWWTFPAVMLATCIPYLVVDLGAFLDDTVWFNLGRAEVNMPTSGIGLPAVAPSFDGAPLALVTVVGLLLALVVPLWAVRRWPSVWVAAGSAGAALLLVLIPARTFQANYLVLVAALLSALWLAAPSTDRTGDEPPGAGL